MRNARQILLGLGIALASLIITLGGLALSLTEANLTAPTLTLPPTGSPTWQPYTPPPLSPTPPPPTLTSTLPPPPTTCPPPLEWTAYVVQAGDTLDDLAARYATSADALSQANCLVTVSLLPGSILYVPRLPATLLPTQTPVPPRTAVPCGPPRTWVPYIVRVGDNLFRLSQAYGVTVRQLQDANCMGNTTLIKTGKTLYVPPWAPRTPSPTMIPIFTDTYLPSLTEPFTATPEDTATPPPTETPTASPTVTP